MVEKKNNSSADKSDRDVQENKINNRILASLLSFNSIFILTLDKA